MNERSFQIRDFSGSINTIQADFDMDAKDSPDRANTRNYPIGKLTKRDGFTAVGVALTGGTAKIDSLYSYDDNTTKTLLGVYNRSVYKWTGSAWEALTIASITLGSATTQFDITNTSGSTYRYTFDGTGTEPNLSRVVTGDIIVLSAQNFNAGNNGTFTITSVGYNYFEVTNASGVAETNKTIGTGSIVLNPKLTPDAIMYFTTGNYKESSTADFSGTATGQTAKTITMSSATRVINQDRGKYIFITTAGKEQFKKIISNTATAWSVDSDWSPTLAGNETFEIYELKPICYMCNDIEPVMKYNGTTLERTYNIPIGKFITSADDRLYIAKGKTLFYSALFNPEDFTVTNKGGFLESKTGKDWTGIGGWSTQIYAFEKDLTCAITRDTEDDPTLTVIDQDVGCCAHRTIAGTGTYLLFLSTSKSTIGVYALAYISGQISVVRPEELSKKIKFTSDIIGLEGINHSVIYKAVAVYHESMYKLFAPFDASSVNSEGRLLDFSQEKTINWNRDTGYNVGSVTIHQESSDSMPTMYYGGSNTAKVYKFAKGTYSDDGVAINGYYFTPIFDLGEFGAKKLFRWLYLFLENIIGKVYVDIIIRNSENKVTFTHTITVFGGDTESGGWGMFAWGMRMWGGIDPIVEEYIDYIAKRQSVNQKGYSIQFKIYNNNVNQTFTLAGLDVKFKPLQGFSKINTN